jgi:hypothetical protein
MGSSAKDSQDSDFDSVSRFGSRSEEVAADRRRSSRDSDGTTSGMSTSDRSSSGIGSSGRSGGSFASASSGDGTCSSASSTSSRADVLNGVLDSSDGSVGGRGSRTGSGLAASRNRSVQTAAAACDLVWALLQAAVIGGDSSVGTSGRSSGGGSGGGGGSRGGGSVWDSSGFDNGSVAGSGLRDSSSNNSNSNSVVPGLDSHGGESILQQLLSSRVLEAMVPGILGGHARLRAAGQVSGASWW